MEIWFSLIYALLPNNFKNFQKRELLLKRRVYRTFELVLGNLSRGTIAGEPSKDSNQPGQRSLPKKEKLLQGEKNSSLWR